MDENNFYDIEKPLLKDNKWLIFKNSVLLNLDTADCNDSIEGVCYKDKTFDECIKECATHEQCEYGYYINNICLPLRDLKRNSNPVYRLRKKEIYPELKNAVVSTFINKDVYKFPPNQANNVFFLDKFILENIDTETFLQDLSISSVEFNKNKGITVQLVQTPPNLSSEQYIVLKYGDEFAFNKPDTAFIIKEEDTDSNLEWALGSFNIAEYRNFYLSPLTPGKKIGDKVSYSDIFNIRTKTGILGVDSLFLLNKFYGKSESSIFRFIPEMLGFYCEKNKCLSMPLKEMIINENGIGRTKNDLEISRSPKCWGLCKDVSNSSKKHKNTIAVIVMIVVIVAVVVMSYITIVKLYRQKNL